MGSERKKLCLMKTIFRIIIAQNIVAEKEDEDKKNQDAEDEEENVAEDEKLFQTHAPNKRAEKRSRLIIWQEKS